VRLHGAAGPYQGDYSAQTLAGWMGAFSTWAAQGRKDYCCFDNDQRGYAAKNAVQMQPMIER